MERGEGRGGKGTWGWEGMGTGRGLSRKEVGRHRRTDGAREGIEGREEEERGGRGRGGCG